MEDAVSNDRSIVCSIPQGSMLGLKLLFFYINDTCNISEVHKFTIIADDTDIFCFNIDFDVLCKQMNTELNRLLVWFNINYRSLNRLLVWFNINYRSLNRLLVWFNINYRSLNINKINYIMFSNTNI